MGSQVNKGEVLGYVDDPYGGERIEICSDTDGVVIGLLELPIVHEGAAVFHIARFMADSNDVADWVESFQLDHTGEME